MKHQKPWSKLQKIEQMRYIARAYATKRECSMLEAVYLVMSELWHINSLPTVVFANSNLREYHNRMCCSKEEIDELPEDSCDVFKRNMSDHYIDRQPF